MVEVKANIYKPMNNSNNSMLPGDPKGSPDESLSDTLVFIDEGFLNKLSKYLGNGVYIKFDKILFCQNICKKENLNCRQIFYYLAPPFQSGRPTKEEELKKEGHDKFVSKLREKGVIVREGRCQRLKIDGKFEFRQKGVDVLLTIDLMKVPIKYPEIEKIILISSDTDFIPAVKEIKDLGINVILYTYYERRRNTNFSRSNDLIKSVNKYVQLRKEDFVNSFLIKKEVNKYGRS